MINYLPKLDSMLWSLKCQERFDTMESLKRAIADHRTRFYRYIGLPDRRCSPGDVQLTFLRDHDPLLGWKNYSRITLDGVIIGYCGE